MRPQTHYARSGDVSIAYQVVGEGPLDLVVVPGWISNVDFAWEDPLYADWVRRLAAFSRVILFDKRGTGLSDRSLGFGSLEERTEDIRAVLDHAGAEQTILYGISESGPLCTYFAARQPERVRALALYGTLARWEPTLPMPIGRDGVRARTTQEWIDWIGAEWGKGEIYQDDR